MTSRILRPCVGLGRERTDWACVSPFQFQRDAKEFTVGGAQLALGACHISKDKGERFVTLPLVGGQI